jgi:isochorismate synthase
MDTSLAEEVQQTMTTLRHSFFFMSPYRSFTTSGCFARFSEPAVGGDAPASFQQKMARLSPTRKQRDRKAGDGGDSVRYPPAVELFIPQRWQTFSRPEKQRPRAIYRAQALDVVARQEIPEQEPSKRWWRAPPR